MKKLIIFNGSPRKTGNTSILLSRFLEGAKRSGAEAEEFHAQELNLEYCRGCMRCNVLGHCSIETDDWPMISKKIREADILVFASPVYFHHVSAPLKKLLDKFRSFVHVRVTETGLVHTPHEVWKKDIILLLSMGSPDVADAKPVIELFEFLASVLGSKNKLHVITANRLIAAKQLLKTADELRSFYRRIDLPEYLAESDYFKNQEILEKCFKLGKEITLKV